MSYATERLLKDLDGRPIPQVYNPDTDGFEPLQGTQSAGSRVNVTGSSFVVGAVGATGSKTVTGSAAAIFAGASALPDRFMLRIYNVSVNTVYWGFVGVLTTTGIPIPPDDYVDIPLDPNVAVAIYLIAGTDSEVRVVELKPAA